MTRLLHHLVDQAAQRRPAGLAVRCNGESLTYEELARRAHGLARLLVETGLQPHQPVAVLLAKSLKVPVALHGVLASGGILVPIDPKSPAEQVARILRATGATRLISEPARRAVVREALASCPQVTHLIGLTAADLDPTDGSELFSIECLGWATVHEAACDRPPEVALIDLDPAYILHTSGSTGTPKLIQHTHRGALSFVEWAAAEYGLTSADRLSNHSSHHTCFATFDYYAAARAGAATVLLTPAMLMMPSSLAAVLEEERVSVWYSVPTALVQLSLRGDLEARDLSALRWLLFAGESFPTKHLRRLIEQLPGARFSHVYGSTEVNVCTYFHLPEESWASEVGEPLPIGKACSTSATLVVDSDGRPVADGEVGELWVRGSTLMSGYWGEPERNRQALVHRPTAGGLSERYFRTGDRVRRREDGNLTFVARADLQIKVRGFRVELGEVEAALLSLDAVEEAAAFAVADGEGSSSLRAALVLRPGLESNAAPVNARAILAELKKILPPHCLPAEIALVASLPRTATGKIDRNALRTPPHSEEDRQRD